MLIGQAAPSFEAFFGSAPPDIDVRALCLAALCGCASPYRPAVIVEETAQGRSELAQVVANLLANARTHTPPGTSVTTSLAVDGDHAVLTVSDDGPGIPVAERSAVLQRFYRGERNRPVTGSGLGLSVVAAIVRLHEFRLTLEDANPGVRAIIDCYPAPVTGIA